MDQLQPRSSVVESSGPGTDPLANFDLIVAVVEKAAVDRLDTTDLRTLVATLTSDPSRFRASNGRVMLTFTGYEADPREVYEIPEVRAFAQALDRDCPHLLWFLDGVSVGVFARCICDVTAIRGTDPVVFTRIDSDTGNQFVLDRAFRILECSMKYASGRLDIPSEIKRLIGALGGHIEESPPRPRD